MAYHSYFLLSALADFPQLVGYIQSQTLASGSQLFCSVVRPLDFYPGRPGSNAIIGGKCFQLCFIPLLQISCCKIGVCHRLDFSSLTMVSCHHK